MYTQCPQCLTYFQVTPEHLRIAQGNVRCGQCRNVFSALGNLTEEPPQVAFDDDESELEEEIFIDEGELEDYAEEYSEEFYVIEEEFEEEFEEAIDEEIIEEEEPAPTPAPPPAPIDLEKTNILPPKKRPQPPKPTPLPVVQAPKQALPNSHKLNEAIATIEKLRQSYSSLSIRQLENRGPLPGAAAPPPKSEHKAQPEPVVPPVPEVVTAPEKPATAAQPPPPKETPTPAPVASQPAKPEKSAPTVADTALEQHPEDDDGVDYEEALNALNELKIIDEDAEETIDDEDQIVLQEPDQSTDEADVFQNDLSIDETDIVGDAQALFDNQALREDILANDAAEHHEANGGVKVKSLNRKASEKSAESEQLPPLSTEQAQPVDKAADKKRKKRNKKQTKKQSDKRRAEIKPIPDSSKDEPQESPKYLPAIPKQLLEDFHPGQNQAPQHYLSMTLWSLGSIVLMVIFLVQTVYFKHNDLARVAPLRPWIESFCGYMSCDLTLPSDVRQLELVSQDIRSHPKVKNALLVTTTIINNAHFVQSYPGLQITFSDLNGQHVAMRRFAPYEYLSADIVKEAGMPPNTPIQVELEMMDPGSNAVNFEFDFIPLI